MGILKAIRNSWNIRILGNYTDFSFQERKKAQYISSFILLLMFYMVPGILVNWTTRGIQLSGIIIFFGYYLSIGGLLFFLRKGRLLFVSWVLLLAGAAKGISLFFYPNGLQFYSHYFLSLLVAGIIHIRKVQLYIVYGIFNVMLLARPFLVRFYINGGILSSNIMTDTLQVIFGGIIFTITVDYITALIDKEILESQKLDLLASTDPLTGLSNRRKLEEHYEAGTTEGRQRTMLLIDLDYFKVINDDFGHEVGDRILKEFSLLLKTSLRDGDTSYRWGGEEFVAILSGQDEAGGVKIAERLCHNVVTNDFGLGRKVSISIGITEEKDGDGLETMFNRADQALYAAKAAGRNRVHTL